MTELDTKTHRLRAWLAERGLGAIHLGRSANVAWLTGGARTYIDTATEGGVATVLVTGDRRYVVTNNIEQRRLLDEEPFDGFEMIASPWHVADVAAARIAEGLALGSDATLDLSPLWAPLGPEEVGRFRALGRDVGAALLEVALAIAPGMTEHRVAGLLARSIYDLGGVPVVVQVAADDRAWRYRHTLPTSAAIERTVLFGVCARRKGLIASASRMVAFGPVSDDLARRVEAVCTVDRAARAATRPAAPLGAVFARIQQAYADVGFAEEWRNHHQGGPCSYGARDRVVRPDTAETVATVQAFAWNPTVPGAKSEDSVLCTADGCENLTLSPTWPQIAGGNDLLRR